MADFKVGDRVQLIDSPCHELAGPAVGAVGTVVDANPAVPVVSWDGFNYIHAEGDEDPTCVAVYIEELELIP